MKKLLALLLGLSVLGLFGCTNSAKGEELTVNEVYNLSTISSINLLNSTNAVAMSKTLTEENESQILENLKLVESFVCGDLVTTTEKESDREGYSKMYEITTSLVNDEKQTYIIYYNEEIDQEEQDEDEIETNITGIIVAGDLEYQLVGNKEMESSDRETESEISFTIYKDANTYVKVKQEEENKTFKNDREHNEYELEYTLYENGHKSLVFEIGVENKGNHLEYEVCKRSDTDALKFKYKYNKENDNRFIIVKMEDENGEEIKGRVNVILNEDGTYHFEYVSNSKGNHNKPTKTIDSNTETNI